MTGRSSERTGRAAPSERGAFYIDVDGQAKVHAGEIDMAHSQVAAPAAGGLFWSVTRIQSPDPNHTVEVTGARGTDYLFTQVPLIGAFRAEMTCGTQVDSELAGLISPGAPAMNFHFPDAISEGFGVEASFEAIERWFGADVPRPVRAVLRRAARGSYHRPAPLPNHLRETVRDALASRGPLRNRLVEGAALLVLSHHLEALAEEGRPVGLAPHEIRAAQEAHARMAAAGASPPGPTELALSLGLPVRRLALAYREVHGHTLLQGADILRLELARRSLLAGKPIKAIADELGYSSVSNFTAAFRRRIGLPPRQWRDLQSRALL